jgi:hypothetical protein
MPYIINIANYQNSSEFNPEKAVAVEYVINTVRGSLEG